jgi:flagellar basal-body rod modification protein FlgD
MASAVTNTTTTVANNANTTVSDGSNPKSKLGSQDFMKLLLTELKYQDPTAPMDTDKMLSQTSQLSALEAQNATKDAMTAMTTAFQASAGYSMASSIGRLANTGVDTVTMTDGVAPAFDAYIPTNSAQASIIIKDGAGNVIKSNDFKNVSQGVITTTWDGTNAAGVKQPDGEYNVSIAYYDANGAAQTSKISTQPITAIRFTTAGNPELKVGSTYMPASSIKEIF